jgi:hypothetical protein
VRFSVRLQRQKCTSTDSSRGSLIEDDRDDGSDGSTVVDLLLWLRCSPASPRKALPCTRVAVDDKGIGVVSDERRLVARQNYICQILNSSGRLKLPAKMAKSGCLTRTSGTFGTDRRPRG